MADDAGSLFTFLDGTYPLGVISIGANTSVSCILKHPQRPIFFGSPHVNHDGTPHTSLNPLRIEVSLLAQRKSRDLAKLSSTARELTWYVMRVVKEMRNTWYGSESNTGARDLGPKWVQMFEAKQKEDFGGASYSKL